MLNVYIALDQSGSMAGNWNETIGSLNGYVTTLQGEDVEAQITVVAFDSVSPYNVLRYKEDVNTFVAIAATEAQPRGGTPLWDTAGRMIAEAEADDLERTIVVFITDGMENGSREFTRQAVMEGIARMEAKNWQTVFLGANFDASQYTNMLGMDRSRSLNTATRGMAQSFSDTATMSAMYMRTGAAMDYTQDLNDDNGN